MNILVVVDPVAHFLRYISSAKKEGLTVLVLTSNPEVFAAEQAGHSEIDKAYMANEAVDILRPYIAGDTTSALKVLEPYRKDIAGVVAGDEVVVTFANELKRGLGLPCADQSDARCQQVKSEMKKRLLARGVATPRFELVTTLEDAEDAWRELGEDCMIKLVDYAMSLGIARATSVQDLQEAWRNIQKCRNEIEHDFEKSSAVIVEQFVGGQGFSVEGYEQDGRIEVLNICEKLVHENFMVIGHFIPAVVSPIDSGRLQELAKQCVKALGITNSVFHAEIHINGDDAYLIECAARPPGQYSVGVIERVYGFDLVDISIDLALGREVKVKCADPGTWNAIVALYSDETGIVSELRGLSELEQNTGCYSLNCGVEVGDPVHKLETFRDILGLAFLETPDPQAVRDLYRQIQTDVRFRV